MAQHIATNTVDQLWYTWSATGLDALAAGFRVRAASPGLTDLYSERMKQLDNYLRYSLPAGSDSLHIRPFDSHQRALLPDDAPVCLTFAHTESGERTLVQKVYTGKDGRGRPGAYFAHMLAKLPGDFSVRDAIRFWRSPFWHTDDASGYVQGTNLPPALLEWRGNAPVEVRDDGGTSRGQEVPKISFRDIEALKRQFKGVDFGRPKDFDFDRLRDFDELKVYERLCFLIRAYLLLRKENEDHKEKINALIQEIEKNKQDISAHSKWRREGRELRGTLEENEAKLELMRRRELRRIFVAATSDEVAYLIAALTRLLPRQFLQDFTFSTYESDVLTRLPLNIVGTCPPPVPLDRESAAPFTLPAASWQQGYVLNTCGNPNRDESSDLPAITTLGYPGPPSIDYVESYARFAVEQLQSIAQEGELQKVRNGASRFTMLEPIEEVDYLFKELGDDPSKSWNELEHKELSVSAFLDGYYTIILRKQLPLQENIHILRDPALALQKLRKIGFRTQIFVRWYRDITIPGREDAETQEEHLYWLSHTFPALITDLRQWCLTDQYSPFEDRTELMRLLESLADDAMKELYQAARQNDQARFLALFTARVTFIERSNIDAWSNLFASLHQNQHTRTLIENRWDVRVTLLTLATTISGLENRDSADFLLSVPLADFGKLLAFLHPLLSLEQNITWKYKAARIFLKNYTLSNAPTASGIRRPGQNVVRQLEGDFAYVEELVKHLLASPGGMHMQPPYAEWRTTALDLLKLFVNSEDYYKSRLLAVWLDDVSRRGILPDLPLDDLQLSPAQEEKILIQYGPTFMQLRSGGDIVAPLFWRMMTRRSKRPMDILFPLLEKEITAENFEALLDPKNFSQYASFQADDIHRLLMSSSREYAARYKETGVLSYSLEYGPLPEYLRLYPQISFWKEAVILLERAKHRGKMLLISIWMSLALNKLSLHEQEVKSQAKEVENFIDAASLAVNEYYAVYREHGPAMLRIPDLASRVAADYGTIEADTSLLYVLLDTYQNYPMTDNDYKIADQLVSVSPPDKLEFVRHYANTVPQLCYHLASGQIFCQQLDGQEIQNYIPGWLRLEMEEEELDTIFATQLEEVDDSLIEKNGEYGLKKYPKSKTLLTLTRYYLQAFDENVPQSDEWKRFIDFLSIQYKNKTPLRSFKNLHELIHNWHQIQQFIDNPSLQHQQLYDVFTFISTKASKPEWIDLLASKLVTRLYYSGELGSIISSLSMADKESTSLCLLSMSEYVKSYVKTADTTWWQRATILLESTFLLPDLPGYISEDVQNQIINNLWQDPNVRFSSYVNYVNQQAQFWLPDIQQVARSYGIIPTRIPRSQKSYSKSTSLSAIEYAPTTVLPVVQPIAPSISVSRSAPLPAQPTPSTPLDNNTVDAPVNFKKSLGGWLIFPWLLVRLGLLCQGSSTGRLVRFWWDHSDALMQGRRLTPHSWKRQLKLACEFYNAWHHNGNDADQSV